jgi:hypothetical protein
MDNIFYCTDLNRTNFLRFEPDNKVYEISIFSSNEEPPSPPDWFTKENLNSDWGYGTYSESKDNWTISFSLIQNSKIHYFFGKYLYGNRTTILIETIDSSPYNKIYKIISKSEHKIKNSIVSSKYKLNNQKDFYPIVLLPPRVIQRFKLIAQLDEICSFLRLPRPILKIPEIPKAPQDFILREVTRIKFTGDGCNFIVILPLAIFFFIAFIYGLAKDLNIFLSFSFLGFSLFLFFSEYKTRSYTDYQKIKIPDDELVEEREAFKIKVLSLQREYDINRENYPKNVSRWEDEIKSKIVKAEDELYKRIFEAKIKFVRTIADKRPSKGAAEQFFYKALRKRFGNEIRNDLAPNAYESYHPDFVCKCYITNFCIDIEIDEPYVFGNSTPTHYIGSTDDKRDDFFLDANWGVIRFSEKQVIEDPEGCCKFIELVNNAILNKQDCFELNIDKDNRWTFEKAQKMAQNKSRMHYLK